METFSSKDLQSYISLLALLLKQLRDLLYYFLN